MDINQVSCSAERMARSIFEILPEAGPFMIIIDKQGNCLSSDNKKTEQLDISRSFLEKICARIDDGAEPVITQRNQACIIAAQLATERTDCGYLVIALPDYTPEEALRNFDLVEILLGQAGLIAEFVEMNNSPAAFELPATACCRYSKASLN